MAPISLQEAQDCLLNQGAKLVHVIASMFAVWPSFEGAIRSGAWVAAPPKAEQVAAPRKRTPTQVHKWIWSSILGRHQCHICSVMSRGTTKPSPGRYKGANLSSHRMHPSHDMHHIASESGDDIIHFCMKCGNYMQAICRGLGQPCKGSLLPKTLPWYRQQELQQKGVPPRARHVHWTSPARMSSVLACAHQEW